MWRAKIQDRVHVACIRYILATLSTGSSAGIGRAENRARSAREEGDGEEEQGRSGGGKAKARRAGWRSGSQARHVPRAFPNTSNSVPKPQPGFVDSMIPPKPSEACHDFNCNYRVAHSKGGNHCPELVGQVQ
jgi:hypothetical protein